MTSRELLRRGAADAVGASLLGQLPARAFAAASSQAKAQEQLKEWCYWLDGLGLREPGSAKQNTYIHFLADQLERIGVSNVHLEPIKIQHFEVNSSSLVLDPAGTAKPVNIGSYIPYSGFTPPQGVTGDLVYVASPADLAAGSLAGKIAILDCPPFAVPIVAFKGLAYYVYDPQHTFLAQNEIYDRPVWQSGQVGALLQYAQQAGAKAAVIVWPYSDQLAHRQYVEVGSFSNTTYQNPGILPGLYVGSETGAMLKQLATGAGLPARLVLDANPHMVSSYNVTGEIPGASKNTILLTSHSDGQNAIEENGGLAIIHVCKRLLKTGCLPQTVTVEIDSGHFGGYAGAYQFIDRHAHDVIARASVNITFEHFGTLEWEPDSSGQYRLNGYKEAGSTTIPANRPLLAECIRYHQRYNLVRSTVLRDWSVVTAGGNAPSPQPGSGAPPVAFEGPGEGIPYQVIGIPTIQYGSAPSYLLSHDTPTADKIDYAQFLAEAESFVQTIWNLSHYTPAELRTTDAALGYPLSGIADDTAVGDVGPAKDVPIAACARSVPSAPRKHKKGHRRGHGETKHQRKRARKHARHDPRFTG